jgi:ABC-type nitrate/sulfonate/bicarbonate transport system permease component
MTIGDVQSPAQSSGRRVASTTPRWASVGVPLIVFAVLILGWEGAVRALGIVPAILPAPSRVLSTLVRERELLLDGMATTFQEIVLGFVLGFAVGIGVALGVVFSGVFRRTVYPLVVVSQLIPVVALAPVLVIILGFGIAPKVVIVALGVFFPITVTAVAGLTSANHEMIDLLRSLSASQFQILRMVRAPAALPYLMTGTQIALTYAVIGAVVAEWPGAQKGLGLLMVTQNALSRTDIVVAAIVIVTCLALVMYALPVVLRRLVIPWERIGKG